MAWWAWLLIAWGAVAIAVATVLGRGLARADRRDRERQGRQERQESAGRQAPPAA